VRRSWTTFSTLPNWTSPPSPETPEVSLFGTGYGESVVVHLGGGEWLIVDSCEHPDSGVVAAKSYLDAVGVARDAVRVVLITHWDDDHIRGASCLARHYRACEVACSSAQTTDEFKTLYGQLLEAGAIGAHGPGIRELRAVLAELARRPSGGAGPRKVTAVGPHQTLWQRVEAGAVVAEVRSLSPSADSVERAIRALVRQTPGMGTPPRSTFSDRNWASVAVSVRVGESHILLGADLENTAGAGRAWRVLTTSEKRIPGLAEVFKVPHHGSDDADEPDVWTTMLAPNPTALLTPFAQGQKPRPQPADVARLCTRTTDLHQAGALPTSPAHFRNPVGRIQTDSTISFQREGKMGHVRLRLSDDGVEVEHFGSAARLCNAA
jgi:hypothetical protein